MTDETEIDDSTHLESVPDGVGCVEIWEHLSGESDESDADEDE